MSNEERPPPSAGPDSDGGDSVMIEVHNQYWEQLRHIEQEMWSVTRIWALILTAIFAFLGTNFPRMARVGAAFFGTVVSILGYFSVYTLRVPFLDYTWKIDLISHNEFDLDSEYRIVNRDVDYRFDHGIDVPDILIGLYTLVAALLVFIIGLLLDETVGGVVLSIGLTLVLLGFYRRVIERKFAETIGDVTEDYAD